MDRNKKVSALYRFGTGVATQMGTRISIMLGFVLFVGGCTSSGYNNTVANVQKTTSKVVKNTDLIPPTFWSQTRHWLQKIEIYIPTKTKQGQPIQGVFMAQLERSKQSEVMVGSTTEGWVLFQTIWDGKSVNLSTKPGIPKQIKPAVILSDMQMALWPAQRLQAWYANNSSLSIRFDDAQRTIYKHKTPWVSIRYSTSPCLTGCAFELTNHHFGYRLKVHNLAAQKS